MPTNIQYKIPDIKKGIIDCASCLISQLEHIDGLETQKDITLYFACGYYAALVGNRTFTPAQLNIFKAWIKLIEGIRPCEVMSLLRKAIS